MKKHPEHIDENQDYILEKIWNSYAITDERRRKAFYYLYTGLFALAGIYAGDNLKIPIFQIELNSSITIALVPSLILVLTGRYLYLSAHTLISYMNYLNNLVRLRRKDLRKFTNSLLEIHSMIKYRDSSEIFNSFLFPKPINPSGWTTEAPKFIVYTVNFLVNFGLLAIGTIPILIYFFSVYKYLVNIEDFSSAINIFILTFYSVMSILLFICPFYFYYRTKNARELFHHYGPYKDDL